jgi:hypothetical protein
VRGEFHRAVGEPTADGGVAAYARIVTEHLLVFPDRDVAEQTADELRDEGFTEVRVLRQPLAGEDDAEADEWAVYVREANVADETGPGGRRFAGPLLGPGRGARRLVRPGSGAALRLIGAHRRW